jgi:shikimate kinase / 3-dehydroquinate synthase
MKPDGMIFLYGPPGSGKSVVGTALAAALELPFFDLDGEIEKISGRSIPSIFLEEGEAGFRSLEKTALQALAALKVRGVTALGGGALLDGENRKFVENHGEVLCLSAPFEVLLMRLSKHHGLRPLIDGADTPVNKKQGSPNERLEALLSDRRHHYSSFPLKMDTGSLSIEAAARMAQIKLGIFRVSGMGAGHEVIVRERGLAETGEYLRRAGLSGPIALVSDENVASLFGSKVMASLEAAGYSARLICLPPGESSKNLQSASRLWTLFLEMRLERGSTVLALGGGVIGDLTGFAASIFLRGIPWAVLPTSLLAMVDSSLGGKTAVDLPEGKNLVGAFHPPSLVLADPLALERLPQIEIRSGLAEVVKAGIIADKELFRLCALGQDGLEQNWDEVIRRAIGVKIQVVQEDPFERGRRAVLNLGHTIGHALEAASNYQLRHGEAVAIGMVLEAKISERLGLAKKGLADEISQVLLRLKLPVSPPTEINLPEAMKALNRDKKRSEGQVRFSLPLEIGNVLTGIAVKEKMICELFSSCTDPI